MPDFFSAFACGYVGATFLLSGGYHAIALGKFRKHLRRHQIVPRSLRAAVAVAVTVFELVMGCAAVMIGFQGSSTMTRTAVFGLSAAAGFLFLLYLRSLLRRGAGGDCGCLPLNSPLTPVSLFPAAAILGVSVLGAASTVAGSGSVVRDSVLLLFPAGWGITLACLAPLFPATMPPLRVQP